MKTHFEGDIWTDGCYDMVHYGHANFLRQASEMGKKLVVGIHSDEEITKNKGKPVMYVEERLRVLTSIRWVDEVVEDVPFITYPSTLEDHKCQVCVHGSDLVLCSDGRDPYQLVKDCNCFVTCPRTSCVSTTDVIERILLRSMNAEISSANDTMLLYLEDLLCKFQANVEPPFPLHESVYVAGNFEILHPSLIDFFKKLKENFSYLIVGVLSDKDVKSHHNVTPIFCSIERGLSMLACRYVDWVVVDPPYEPTQEFLAKHKAIVKFGKRRSLNH